MVTLLRMCKKCGKCYNDKGKKVISSINGHCEHTCEGPFNIILNNDEIMVKPAASDCSWEHE